MRNYYQIAALCLGLAGVIMLYLGVVEPDKTESFRVGVQGMLAMILSTQIQNLGNTMNLEY